MADAFGSSSNDFLQQANDVDWTADPNTLLVSNAPELAKLLQKTRSSVATLIARKEHDFGLMRRLGEEVERLSGHRDFSFFEELPAVGTQVLLLRALCELRGLTLADGGCTITGAFVDSYERVTGIKVVRTNIAGLRCHRKGKNGKELKGGEAGCKDPKSQTLRVLADLKELHYLALLAAGVEVLGIIAASDASIASFFGASQSSKMPRFTPCKGSGTYENVDIFCAPHPKFASPRCFNAKSVMLAFDALGDTLKLTSQIVLGWAKIAATAMPVEGEQTEETTRKLYEALRKDEQSPAVARAWADRDTTTTSPEVKAKLEAEMRKSSSSGGQRGAATTNALSLTSSDPTERKKAQAVADGRRKMNAFSLTSSDPTERKKAQAVADGRHYGATTAPSQGRCPVLELDGLCCGLMLSKKNIKDGKCRRGHSLPAVKG